MKHSLSGAHSGGFILVSVDDLQRSKAEVPLQGLPQFQRVWMLLNQTPMNECVLSQMDFSQHIQNFSLINPFWSGGQQHIRTVITEGTAKAGDLRKELLHTLLQCLAFKMQEGLFTSNRQNFSPFFFKYAFDAGNGRSIDEAGLGIEPPVCDRNIGGAEPGSQCI